jgi:hypothetical protein
MRSIFFPIICAILWVNSVISQQDHYFLKDTDSSILQKEIKRSRYWTSNLAMGQTILILKLSKSEEGYYLTYKSSIQNVCDSNRQMLNVYFAVKKRNHYKISQIVTPIISSDSTLTVFIPNDLNYFFLNRSYFLKYDFKEIQKDYKKHLRRNKKNRYKNYVI